MGRDPHGYELQTRVRHALRIKGLAMPEALAGMVVSEPHEIEVALKALSEAGEAKFRDGRLVSGWTLTDIGRERHAERLRAEQENGQYKTALRGVYDGFLKLNPQIKDACTAWQLAGEDAESRNGILTSLADVHTTAVDCLRRASVVIPRFSAYEVRLEDALNQALAGDERFIASPRVDSYHTVWFECHEDFLVTLGLSRSEEGSY